MLSTCRGAADPYPSPTHSDRDSKKQGVPAFESLALPMPQPILTPTRGQASGDSEGGRGRLGVAGAAKTRLYSLRLVKAQVRALAQRPGLRIKPGLDLGPAAAGLRLHSPCLAGRAARAAARLHSPCPPGPRRSCFTRLARAAAVGRLHSTPRRPGRWSNGSAVGPGTRIHSGSTLTPGPRARSRSLQPPEARDLPGGPPSQWSESSGH